MSMFKQTKDAVMLLITVFVLIFITGFLYLVLGNYAIGSAIDISDQEAGFIALRTLKCLDKDEKLSECIKTDKYGIEIFWYENGKREHKYVNKELYEKLGEKPSSILNIGTLMEFGKFHPGIIVQFEK